MDGLRVGLEPDTVHINSINITSQNPQLEAGQQVFIHLTFNETITVNNSSGTPFIEIQLPDKDDPDEAYYTNLTGNNTLIFAYTLRGGEDTHIDNITIPGGIIDPNGGYLRSGSAGKELDLRFSDYDPKGGITVTETNTSTGPYSHGTDFTVNLTFDDCISVTGRPSLNIKVGGVDRKARSSSTNCNNNMNTILPFSYTLSTQDTELDPIYVPAGTVNLDGGAITSSESFPIDINYQYPEANIITIDSLEVTSTGPYDVNTNNKVLVDAMLSDNVEVSELDVGKPSINILVKGRSRKATYEDTSHTDGTLTFAYEVTASDSDPEDEDIQVPEMGSISLNGSQVRNTSHKNINLNYNFSQTAQTLSPITVRSLDITSEGPYVPNNNDKILIDVTFSAPVTVTRGIPSLHIQVGGEDRFASYSLSDDMNNVDNTLTFVYQVTGSDSNMDNIVIPQGRINTNGSEIRDTAQLRKVQLTHSSQSGGGGTTRPPNSITANSIEIQSNDGNEVLIDITFSDNVEITGRNRPTINIQVGGNNRRATYSPTDDRSNTDHILTFAYQFSRSDSDTDNIAIPTGQINLRGSSLTDSSSSSYTVSLELPAYEPPGTEPPDGNTCTPSDLDTSAAFLENPVNNSIKSGVHIISGWACEARRVQVYLNDNRDPYPLLYGASRTDTECVCGDSNNGFIGLFNYNLLDDGQHTIALHVDGKEVSRRRFRVVTLGEEFVRGESASGELNLSNGIKTFFKWEQGRQGFDITGFRAKVTEPEALSETTKPGGFLELPRDGSIKAGVHIISGWVCRARNLTLKIHNSDTEAEIDPINILYGSERSDTEEVCGDTNNGFATIFNYNLLEAGTYVADLYVDDQWHDSAQFKVVRMGSGPNFEFVRGINGTGTVEMEVSGQTVTLGWEQATQGLEIKDVREVQDN